jgi:hypothetical protein
MILLSCSKNERKTGELYVLNSDGITKVDIKKVTSKTTKFVNLDK